MRKLWKKSSALFLALIFTVMAVLPVAASQATSYTYTMDDQSEMVSNTGCLPAGQNHNRLRSFRSGGHDY